MPFLTLAAQNKRTIQKHCLRTIKQYLQLLLCARILIVSILLCGSVIMRVTADEYLPNIKTWTRI